MATATCNACNVRFVDDEQKRLHYRSDWHCFNLKRKVTRSSPLSFAATRTFFYVPRSELLNSDA
jgi:hypothetical protein